jgi:hypothetical protein
MDCAAVINLQDQQSHLPPEGASDQKRLYGALLRALIQGKGTDTICELHLLDEITEHRIQWVPSPARRSNGE